MRFWRVIFKPKTKEIAINPGYGVNDVVFGMMPKDVEKHMGAAEKTTNVAGVGDNELSKRVERRGKVSYIYENDKLI